MPAESLGDPYGSRSPNAGKKKTKPHYHDHRERLRDKFTRRGAEAFEDYELLELILFQALPRIDTKPIAEPFWKNLAL